MSKKKSYIEILPEHLTVGSKGNKEQFVSSGHKCSYCQGNGYFWKENKYGESYKDPCPICGGCGELEAVVTVEWRKAK